MKKQNLGKVITQQAYKFQFEKMTMWEEHIKLFLKPKPRWIPSFVWGWMIRLMLQQKTEVMKKADII